jgi:hypothetical protein
MASQVDDLLEVYGAAQLEHGFGVSVVLMRGGLETAPFTATWARHEYEVSDQEGFLTKRTSRDFVFPTAAVVLSGQTAEPRAGDRLRLTEAGATVEYELVPMGKLPAVETMPGGYRWKVHTKKVEG